MKLALSLFPFTDEEAETQRGPQLVQGHSTGKWWSPKMASGNLVLVPSTAMPLGLLQGINEM